MSLGRDIAKARAWERRSRKRLPAQSAKRAAEKDERDRVKAAALKRDGFRCIARDLVPEVTCWGPLDPDEIMPRSAYPGGHLDLANVQTLCRAHHDWKHAHAKDAEALGLRRWSWDR